MNHKFEILAPGGDLDSIKAGIVAGAGAIYCGLGKFNARTSATNISFDELVGIIRVAHQRSCQIFLTLNILILEQEIPDLIRLLNRLINTKLDGVIVQDLGLFYLLSEYFESLVVHASTQAVTHNIGQIDFFNDLNVKRVVLARELRLDTISSLTKFAHCKNMETEVFVHGSYCIGFSGICYYSSVLGGKSGNRGLCAQPCRDQYIRTKVNRDFPLNLKDNSAFFDIAQLEKAKVDSLKIEGRIKKADYVFTTVSSWKKQIDYFNSTGKILDDNTELYKVFNRDFSNGFLKGELGSGMFIDNPRSNITPHFSRLHKLSSEKSIGKLKDKLHNEKTDVFDKIRELTLNLDIGRQPLTLTFSGKEGMPLVVLVQTPDRTFSISSSCHLTRADKYVMDRGSIEKRFSMLAGNEYILEPFNLEQLDFDLFISFRNQTALRNEIVRNLNGGVDTIAPVELPKLPVAKPFSATPQLSVLISEPMDLSLMKGSCAEFFYQLPDSIGDSYSTLAQLFNNSTDLIPWFPSLLIGKDFTDACELLKNISPKRIVANNLGIARLASKMGIEWIAGPYLNVTNSYSLKCLKEKFNCSGSFISNELKLKQIKWIRPPADFDLYYSIFHPIMLMSCQQCLFLTTTGCSKKAMDKDCIQSCVKRTTIEDLKGNTFSVNKIKGSSNTLYGDKYFLNTSISSDLPNRFSNFLIDLRDISTSTEIKVSREAVIEMFEDFLKGNDGAVDRIQNSINQTTLGQYYKGL
ncbi:MAG: U32 family peptidase [Bacteriovoracaceae bacterium]|nr:U32 family peptidase [Bacteriovoracaceae bacterium]